MARFDVSPPDRPVPYRTEPPRRAGLVDLHPNRNPAGVGLTTAIPAAGGIGLSALASSALVQLGTLPRVLPYVVLFVLFALAFAGAYWMPEPTEKRGRFRLKAGRPRVPAVVRRPFLLAALAVSPHGRSAVSSSRSARSWPPISSTRAT